MIKRQSNGKWICDLQPGGRTGKRIKKVFATQKEAKQFEVWVVTQLSKEPEWTPTKKDNRRLSNLLEIWWNAHGYSLSSGKDMYRRLKAICTALSDPHVENFSTQTFADYRTARSQAGVTLNTLNREHAYLRSVFGELIRLGAWRKVNPLKNLRQFKLQENELSYLTGDQIQLLLRELAQSRNPHVLLIAEICLMTGARWGEAQGLKVTQVRNGVIQFAQTKSKKTRAVPISPELEKKILAHYENNNYCPSLFESSHAALISALSRTKIKLPKGQAAHVLRHTFASHFMMRGGNILVLQKILGHSDLKMTMRYAHLSPGHLEEAKRLNPLSKGGM